jgi:hypothetical protein
MWLILTASRRYGYGIAPEYALRIHFVFRKEKNYAKYE